MDDATYYGLVFFDPELRHGLEQNARRYTTHAPDAPAAWRPTRWFQNVLRRLSVAGVGAEVHDEYSPAPPRLSGA